MYLSEMINFNNSKNIIIQIEEKLNSNFDKLNKAIESDNEFFCENISLKKITNTFNIIKNENWNFKESEENIFYTSLGNIAVIYNGQPDIAMYMILKSIKTNNNLVLFNYINNHT